MIEKIKKAVKDAWVYVWGKTNVDEKAIAAAEEVKRRAKNVKEELKDVVVAAKELGNQIGDVAQAAKGKKRQGRKKKK